MTPSDDSINSMMGADPRPTTLLERVNSREAEVSRFVETVANKMFEFGIKTLTIELKGKKCRVEMRAETKTKTMSTTPKKAPPSIEAIKDRLDLLTRCFASFEKAYPSILNIEGDEGARAARALKIAINALERSQANVDPHLNRERVLAALADIAKEFQ